MGETRRPTGIQSAASGFRVAGPGNGDFGPFLWGAGRLPSKREGWEEARNNSPDGTVGTWWKVVQVLRSAGDQLSLVVRRAFPDALVVLSGEVDAANVGELYEQFAELAGEGIRRISLDLADLTFMDSTGLSLLIALHNRTQASGGELVIFSPTPFIRRLFAVTRLDSFFDIRPVNPLEAAPALVETPAPVPLDGIRQAG